MSNNDFAAGVIVVHVAPGGQRRYLIIKNSAGHWELPKGHAKPGETWQQTAVRELHEETGIGDIELIPSFSRQIRYVFRDRSKGIVHKTVRFALGNMLSQSIQLSDEHTEFALLEFEKAAAQLTHVSTRAMLHDAEAFMLQYVSPPKARLLKMEQGAPTMARKED